eukprot:8928474-Lingulodinium_polyedra.AAC.1
MARGRWCLWQPFRSSLLWPGRSMGAPGSGPASNGPLLACRPPTRTTLWSGVVCHKWQSPW